MAAEGRRHPVHSQRAAPRSGRASCPRTNSISSFSQKKPLLTVISSAPSKWQITCFMENGGRARRLEKRGRALIGWRNRTEPEAERPLAGRPLKAVATAMHHGIPQKYPVKLLESEILIF